MRPTERSARKPSLKTGLRATLRGLLHARGSGAPSHPRALTTLAVLATALGALAFMSAPALAAAPETPETLKPESVTGSGALLEGVLNPGKEGPAGEFEIDTYEFLYNKASAGKCEGGSTTGGTMSLGGGMEHVPSQPVSGLEPHTKYMVCLAVSNGVEAVGAPVSFVTGPVQAPEGDAVSEVTGASAKLSGVLDSQSEGEVGSYAFRYSPSGSECEQAEATSTAGEGELTGKQGQAVSGEATGLLPDTTYTFCLVAIQNPAREGEEVAKGQPVTFTTAGVAPTIGVGEAVSVGSNEVTVGAPIDPGGLHAGYYVEYGTSAAYGARTPEIHLGAGISVVTVRVRLGGLQSSTEYHFRFVVKNGAGVAEGTDETFTTTLSASGLTSALPDNRAYELVSSPTANITVDSVAGDGHATGEKEGSGEPGGEEYSIQPDRASVDGEALAYTGFPGSENGNASYTDHQSNEWLATRSSAGWSTGDITAPGTSIDDEYSFFTEDLSADIFFIGSNEPVVASPEGPPNCGGIYSRSTDGGYHSLVPTSGGCGRPAEADGSADGTHLLFKDEAALTAGATAGPFYSGSDNLYDSVGGSLYQVNILPDGQPEPSPRASLGVGAENDVSADGSRVFWESGATGGLYVRENDTQPQSPSGECVSGDACTVQVDAGEAACVAKGQCNGGGGQFWNATADGSKVFFTDTNPLTADSTAAAGEPDLYEYEVATGVLTDLTVAGSGHANVQGVIGASEDGEYVYFAANGVLASNANANGETAQKDSEEGRTLLYERHNGVTTFVAGTSLFELQYMAGLHPTDWDSSPDNRVANVSKNGATLVFLSQQRLTSYNNEGIIEAYLYQASTGRVSCATCSPIGAAPVSFYGHEAEPTPLPVLGGGGEYTHGYKFGPRVVSASGARVFFDSRQPLVPQATNGLMNVYEWERPASASEANNSCSVSSQSYSAVNAGCVYLLSGGQSTDDSFLAETDAEGNNVFFTSRGQFTSQAVDENVAMYDARVGGGFTELSTECSGTGCQGVPPAPPIFATPSSVTYDGVGNFEPQPPVVEKPVVAPVKCAKGKVRKAARCVKKKGLGKAKRPVKRAKRRKK
jgi:hypothetical protein